MSNHTFTYPWQGLEGTEIALEISFDYTPADPGRLYGLPENCYPPEPEHVEITACVLDAPDVPRRTSSGWTEARVHERRVDLLDVLSADFVAALEQAASEWIAAQAEAAEEARAEDLADQQAESINWRDYL